MADICFARIDEDGTFTLPEPVASRLGVKPGDKIRLSYNPSNKNGPVIMTKTPEDPSPGQTQAQS